MTVERGGAGLDGDRVDLVEEFVVAAKGVFGAELDVLAQRPRKTHHLAGDLNHLINNTCGVGWGRGLRMMAQLPLDRVHRVPWESRGRDRTSSRVFLNLCSMWMSDVAMKVWMRGNLAPETALAHVSMSSLVARARPQMIGGFS